MGASRGLLSFFLFCSGACALVYEIAWLRLLSLTVGNTSYATSAILAVFLGGLAIGAYLAGLFVDKKSSVRLATYGMIEMAIGVTAPIVTRLVKMSPALLEQLASALPQNWAARVLLIAVLDCIPLLLPTMLMGATLPIVIKYVQRVHKQSEWFSWLYGMNTLGAVIGSFRAPFLGFAYIGITATTLVAGLVNIGIGCACLFLSKHSAFDAPQVVAEGSSVSPASNEVVNHGHVCLLAALSFISGFTAVSYEVLWTRLLRFYTGSLTYAFSVMIGTFLLGLAAGSFWYQKRIMPRDSTNAQRFLRYANLQTLALLACAGSLICVPSAMVIGGLVPGAFPMENPFPLLLSLALVSAVVMFLPTFLIGTLFPLIGTIAASVESSAAAAVGKSYALNTIGCVLGSILTGLVLIPTIGSYRAFQAMVLVSALAALLAVVSTKASRPKLVMFGIVPTVLAVCFITFVYVPFSHFLVVLEGTVLKTGEDSVGSMMVLDFPKSDTRVLMMNGSSLATTAMPSRRYMRLLGHLPALLGNDPRDAMVACFGTGTTCGAISLHPEVKSVRLVELSQMVVNSGDLFSKSNQNALHSPKLNVAVTDARNFLVLTNQSFDVITFEPPPPCDSGIVNLYTTDFYRLARKHLRPGGLMCQWVPQHEVSTPIWKMQAKSALEVFPYVSVWLPNSGEALLVCSDREPNFDKARIERRIQEDPTVKASLAEIGIKNADDLLATYVCGPEVLRRYVGDVPALTDDRPSLEFFHPYLGPAVPDASLYDLAKDDRRARGLDANVQNARQALRLTFDGTTDGKRRALEMDPENNWFRSLNEK